MGRLVADGHLTDILLDSVYSGVVSLRGFRLVLFLGELNNLEVWSTDIGNAYLEAMTSEKVYIIAGPEFGELEGHILIIHKALYGLRSSGARWHDKFADCLRDQGFQQCKAEPDIWLRENKGIYEYIAVYANYAHDVDQEKRCFVKMFNHNNYKIYDRMLIKRFNSPELLSNSFISHISISTLSTLSVTDNVHTTVPFLATYRYK